MRPTADYSRQFIVQCVELCRNIQLDKMPFKSYLGIIISVEVAHEDVPPVADDLPALLQPDLDPRGRLAGSRELAEPETSIYRLHCGAETCVTNWELFLGPE